MKKRCIDSVKERVIEHIGEFEEKEEREAVLGLSAKEYFSNFENLYSKNVFCEYEFD